MEINVLDYGAKGDGVNIDTAAIQTAIDDCSRLGGGRVLIPGGHTFLTGSLILRSNIEFHIEMGAELIAVKDIEKYSYFKDLHNLNTDMKVPSYVNCDYEGKPKQYFIYAKDASNVAITGFGKIDASEEIFYGDLSEEFIDGSYYPRIPVLYLENVKQLTIKDITISRSAFWTVHMIGCRDVLIDGIRIYNNMKLANCDGIDPDHCKDVRINNCYIECADDCIVFKNTAAYREYGACENISVTNCTLKSSSAAFKFGTESCGEFRNFTISNCNVKGIRGISMQLRDDGKISNVLFSNINIETEREYYVFWGEAEPIAITAIDRNETTHAGQISNIKFDNINCNSENGILIYGNDDEDNIRDITFRNINLNIVKKTDYPKKNFDLRPSKYADFIETDSHTVYERNSKGIIFDNLKIDISDEMKVYVKGADTENVRFVNYND